MHTRAKKNVPVCSRPVCLHAILQGNLTERTNRKPHLVPKLTLKPGRVGLPAAQERKKCEEFEKPRRHSKVQEGRSRTYEGVHVRQALTYTVSLCAQPYILDHLHAAEDGMLMARLLHDSLGFFMHPQGIACTSNSTKRPCILRHPAPSPSATAQQRTESRG